MPKTAAQIRRIERKAKLQSQRAFLAAFKGFALGRPHEGGPAA